MTPQVFGLPGGSEWIILLIVALLLFGGTRLAGLGKGAGRAIREFKEETQSLHKADAPAALDAARDAEPRLNQMPAQHGQSQPVQDPTVPPRQP